MRLILTIVIIFLLFKAFYKPSSNSNNSKFNYRIALSDPLTGASKYLSKIDGINNTFKYTENEEETLIFKDLQYTKQILASLPANLYPRIEVRKHLFWSQLK
ncbi:BapA protein [Limosilactobacillus antri DSM 16041]|nr:BapA protein [Limosilactobacillus antri DSM 16041]